MESESLYLFETPVKTQGVPLPFSSIPVKKGSQEVYFYTLPGKVDKRIDGEKKMWVYYHDGHFILSQDKRSSFSPSKNMTKTPLQWNGDYYLPTFYFWQGRKTRYTLAFISLFILLVLVIFFFFALGYFTSRGESFSKKTHSPSR